MRLLAVIFVLTGCAPTHIPSVQPGTIQEVCICEIICEAKEGAMEKEIIASRDIPAQCRNSALQYGCEP